VRAKAGLGFVVALLLVATSAAGGSQPARDTDVSPSSAPRWVPGEILVRFERSVAPQARSLVHSRLGGEVESSIAPYRVQVVSTPDGVGVNEAVARYESSPLVDVAEPNFLRYPLEIPNDELFRHLWGLRNVGQRHAGSFGARGLPDADIDATRAWDVEEGDPSTVIAVADTGVAVDHRDLDANIWDNPGEVPGDGIDNDANGYIDDVHGWDFAEEDNSLVERRRHISASDHGTHVAGTIAAEKNNGIGVAGVCPDCRIMVLKISRAVPRDDPHYMNLPLSALLEGLAYAQQNGADVLNASFGYSTYSRLEREAFSSAVDAGVLPVIAAGNSRSNNDLSPLYPASYDIPGTLTVAASNDRDRYAGFSSYGAEVAELAAPGEEIMSTILFGEFASFSGTSMATPHTVGAAGLVESRHPTWSPLQVKNALLNSVDHPEGLNSFDGGFGRFTQTGGRLNAARALDASPERRMVPSNGTIRGSLAIARRASGQLSWPEDTNDVFRSRLSAGRRVKVVLEGFKDFELHVWKPGTTDIWQWERGCFRGDGPCQLVDSAYGHHRRKVATFTARMDGDYFFHVSNSRKDAGRYTLKIRRL
jgi:thermitase